EGGGEVGRAAEPLGLGARRAGRGERLCERARIETLAPQGEAVHARLGGIDHHGGQGDEVLSRLLEGGDPAPLALAQLRGREQLADRDDAGERRADVVREAGQRQLERARRARAAPPLWPGLCFTRYTLRHCPPPPAASHECGGLTREAAP